MYIRIFSRNCVTPTTNIWEKGSRHFNRTEVRCETW